MKMVSERYRNYFNLFKTDILFTPTKQSLKNSF